MKIFSQKWVPYVLPAIVVLGFSGVYLLPSRGEMAESSIKMELPLELGYGWRGAKRQETEIERSVLAADTKFAKADYSNYSLYPLPVHTSIVLSGHDLNNSIHRPERCLPAQGHFNLQGSDLSLRISDDLVVPFHRLTTQQSFPIENGKNVTIGSVHYYVFVGNNHITGSHMKRTIIDMSDRLMLGRDQRWAYLQISAWYGDEKSINELIKNAEGKINKDITQEDADKAIQQLLLLLIPKVIDTENLTK